MYISHAMGLNVNSLNVNSIYTVFHKNDPVLNCPELQQMLTDFKFFFTLGLMMILSHLKCVDAPMINATL